MKILTKEATVTAPLPAVWEAWTTSEGVKTFFGHDATVELKLGGAYEILFDDGQPKGQRGSEGMTVLSYWPERVLSFSWNAPPLFDALRQAGESTWVVVTFTLADDGRVKVSLAQLGWGEGEDWDELYGYFDRAWSIVMARLVKRFLVGPIDWDE